MVTKSKKTSVKKEGRVQVGSLKLNKETVRELSKEEGKEIKGGQAAITPSQTGLCGRAGCVLKS